MGKAQSNNNADQQTKTDIDATGSDMVVVGCKLPHGLDIHINDQHFVLRGANSSVLVGGFGCTSVPREFMDEWMARHKSWKPVTSGNIFVVGDKAAAEKEAAARRNVRSGFEGLNSDAPAPGVTEDPDTKARREAGEE